MTKSRSGRSKKRADLLEIVIPFVPQLMRMMKTSELNSTESASAKKLESSHTSLEIFSERLFETSKKTIELSAGQL
ncbi:hypothetical protein TNCV_117201 [Trichonephila clavipes]|nr:hypothetical protein TNCV_117201 [Trichonephila clavipes]